MPGYKSYAAVAIIGIMAPLAANGQDKADCSDPQTQTEMTLCARMDYNAADAELNRVYKTAVRSMRETDANLPPEIRGAEKALRGAQRAWIPYRDKACAAYGFLARGGTMEPMLVAACLADITRKRTEELRALAAGLGN